MPTIHRVMLAGAVVCAIGAWAFFAWSAWFVTAYFFAPDGRRNEAELGYVMASVAGAILWVGAAACASSSGRSIPTWLSRAFTGSWFLFGFIAVAVLTALQLAR